jgi:hypothetical protein
MDAEAQKFIDNNDNSSADKNNNEIIEE